MQVREWLHDPTVDPTENADGFVRAVVQAAFSDANGPVEGLTRKQIDLYVDQCLTWIRTERHRHVREAAEAIASQLGEAGALAEQLAAVAANNTTPTHQVSRDHAYQLDRIAVALDHALGLARPFVEVYFFFFFVLICVAVG